MNDLEKRWNEYFFFGGPQPSLMEGVKPVKPPILKHIEVKGKTKTYKVTVRIK